MCFQCNDRHNCGDGDDKGLSNVTYDGYFKGFIYRGATAVLNPFNINTCVSQFDLLL